MDKQNLIKTTYFINNKYLNLYLQLINNNINTKHIKFETACHHIIPVSYFKLVNKDVDNSNFNKVNLYHKDHILAHYYLSKCTKSPLKEKMVFALNFMINEKGKYDIDDKWITDNIENLGELKKELFKYLSKIHTGKHPNKDSILKMQETKQRLYGDKNYNNSKQSRETFLKNHNVVSVSQLPGVGEKISKSKKGISTVTEEQRKILSESATKFWTGKPKSEETKNKISNTLKGHEVSQETRNKISIACKGNIAPNKNTIAVHNFKTIYLEFNLIPYDQLLQYLLNNKLEIGCRQSNSRLKNRDFNYYKIKAKKQLLNIKNKYNNI